MKNKILFIIPILLFVLYLFPINCFASQMIDTITQTPQKPIDISGDVFDVKTPNDNSKNTGDSEDNIITSAQNQGGNVSTKFRFKNANELNNALDNLFGQIRWIISIISVFGTITSFLVLALAFIRLANAPSASFQRRNVMIDILQSIVATILLGGLSLIMTVFYKTFSSFITKNVMLITDYKTAIAMALIEYKYLISGILGFLSLTMIIILIKDIIELAVNGTNPQSRAHSIKGILFTGLATIGLGGTGIFVAIFNGLLTF